MERQGAPLSEAEAALVLTALRYLHVELRALHRDVKAANVLLTASGAARANSCTPHWMAPEAFAAVDIWGVGITAIELMSIKPPWSSLSSVFEIILAIEKNPPPEGEGSPVLRDFGRGALVKDAVARPSAEARHPNIVGYYDYFTRLHDGEELLWIGAPLSEAEAALVLTALRYLHVELRALHRDVKAANLMSMKPPWSSLSSVFDIILAIVNNPPPEAEGSPVLRDFVRCALVKDAVARPSADVLLKHKLVAGARSDALAAVVKKGAPKIGAL
ncbi:hypothetical protein EMIHUDRAFT_225894 [Emiliania huxleyi CCMP1516]|uniref:Protein kinase domain-containing protein n=2 Tax=Emiliania huxleyi TaxID=2903 RepID=A0A0D3KN47_EMIH1|nr:hypothetical protein EMIHUDRAFT_225894 [Emiliania huxleyi CCMP1516]EOD37182.1 hypothetical protein EMIHUDRAFT_225894 [Emiliania huxleyi CCMP1516]|eukprot:XP_005789611.1 hypothetical protein EMIHUDRAFT_225894 [Emiliania huxleyi CCMP1516]